RPLLPYTTLFRSRARGDRPGLAGPRRRLDDRLPVEHGPVPPDHRAVPARGLPPHGRPQPGLAGPPEPARSPGPGVPGRLGAAHPGAPPLARGAAGLVRRFPGGLGHPVRAPQTHEVAYGVAADPAGPAPGHLTSSCAGTSEPRPGSPAHARPTGRASRRRKLSTGE